jgi:hypothetical protein
MTPARPQFDYVGLPATQADELRAKAKTIRSRTTTMTPAIIDIGRNLLVAKQTLPHGRFSPWVETECGFAPRTAQNYMRVAEFADGKRETVSLLTPSAIYALASKKAPPVVVHRVLQLLESNRVPTECDVLRMLAEAREIKAERSQTSNAGPEVQKADDLASRLLISIGRDFARLLVEGPWDQIGAFQRLKLNHEQARPSEHHGSDVSAGDPTPTKTVGLVRDPSMQIGTDRKSSTAATGEYPPFWTGKLGRQLNQVELVSS